MRMNEQDDKREALITDPVVVAEAETPTMHPACEICGKYVFAVDGCKGHAERWYKRLEDKKAPYLALVRRLVEIADNPSATERMVDYDRVARAHEKDLQQSKEAILAAEGAG